MTALENEYRYLISRAKSAGERKRLIEHALRFDLDLTDLL